MTTLMLTARAHTAVLAAAQRLHRDAADERGQGTVEYVGLAMAIGVLLLAVSSFLPRWKPFLRPTDRRCIYASSDMSDGEAAPLCASDDPTPLLGRPRRRERPARRA